MPGPSSNPALTADLGRNLRDRHPEIFRRASPAPLVIPSRVRVSQPPAPEPAPQLYHGMRRSLLGRLLAAALGLSFSPK